MQDTELQLESVEKLVNDIWGKFLGMEIHGESQPEGAPFSDSYFAWVRIVGHENITIILKCPESLARWTTAAMYEDKPEQMDNNQIQDCLKEIVNILGGNVKGMLSKYHLLSIPFVSGPGRGPQFPPQDYLGQFYFQSLGQSLQLTFLKVA